MRHRTMIMKVNFTQQFFKKCKPPLKGRVYFHDTQEKGLSAYVTPHGVITFFVRKRVGGKDVRIHLGHLTKMSVEKARKKAVKVKADVAEGIDPNELLLAVKCFEFFPIKVSKIKRSF